MLSQNQKDAIVTGIIAKLPGVKILNSFVGKFALRALVNEVDSLLSNALPPDISVIIADVDKGLTQDEITHLKQVLPGYILSRIHNAILQGVLSQIIEVLVDLILEALTQGKSLPQ